MPGFDREKQAQVLMALILAVQTDNLPQLPGTMTPIDDLPLSRPVINALTNNNLAAVNDIAACGADNLDKLPGTGRRKAEKIKAVLLKAGGAEALSAATKS